MENTFSIKTGAWYGDRQINLEVPASWDLSIINPLTPAPLTDEEIVRHLEHPAGQSSIREMCEGKSRPIIIVDDLNRPTPASRVMPFLLKYFQEAKIDLSKVTILMATGTHGTPTPGALGKKVGTYAASKCKLLIHNCYNNVKKIGITSFGTPVFVNKIALKNDMLIGIGGIYPNHTAGYGGGSKIALGVLGIRSIFYLHHRHRGMGWGKNDSDNTFRKDLDEIAEMIKLNTIISLHLNQDREIIKIHCGDPKKYYTDAVNFSKKIFAAPIMQDADIIISNTYPNDLSLTFARMKGFIPLNYCKPGASRVAIASCDEGVGLHGLFPYLNYPLFFRIRNILRHLSILTINEILEKIFKKVIKLLTPQIHRFKKEINTHTAYLPNLPIWVFISSKSEITQLKDSSETKIRLNWKEIIHAVNNEQGKNKRLKVVVYPCAFLQHFYTDNT